MTLRSQKFDEKLPDNLGAVKVVKKDIVLCSTGSSIGLRGRLAGTPLWVGLRVLAGVGVAYPSHFRPVEVHRLQFGFSSPHLTRRILEQVSAEYSHGISGINDELEGVCMAFSDLLACNTTCPYWSSTDPISVR